MSALTLSCVLTSLYKQAGNSKQILKQLALGEVHL